MTTLPHFQASFTLQELIDATQATVTVKHDDFQLNTPAYTVSTDSRTLQSGQVFLPLVGESFDGHRFLDQLDTHGVSIAVCSKAYATLNLDKIKKLTTLTLLLVDDTLEAYQAIARFHRRRLTKTTIIGLTGSSGKTTMKDYLRQILCHQFTTQATLKNYNNDVGVPQTLLSIAPETEVAIIEMGMRGLGEIRRLSKTAEPDIAMLINVGPAHIERLGTLDNIIKAKCEILDGLKPEGIFISNGDDEPLQDRLSRRGVKEGQTHIRYCFADTSSIEPLPDARARFTVEGVTMETPLPGRHQVSNVLGALKVAKQLGMSGEAVAEALKQYDVQEGRFERVDLGNGHSLINDAYNANPASMHASLSAFLASAPHPENARRVLILGSMKELGNYSRGYHHELVEGMCKLHLEKVAVVAFVGTEYDGIPISISGPSPSMIMQASTENLISRLFDMLNPQDGPLEFYLKGSRSHALETLIPRLKESLKAH